MSIPLRLVLTAAGSWPAVTTGPSKYGTSPPAVTWILFRVVPVQFCTSRSVRMVASWQLRITTRQSHCGAATTDALRLSDAAFSHHFSAERMIESRLSRVSLNVLAHP